MRTPGIHRHPHANALSSRSRHGMGRIVAVALALCFAFSPAWADVPFRSDNFGFSIVFPSAPEMEEREILAPSGTARLIRLSAKDAQVRASLTLVSFSHPAFTPEEISVGLGISRDNQVNRVNGRLVFESDVILNGYAGKEIMIAFGPPTQNYRYRGRTYYVGSRQFILSVIGVTSDVTSPGADAYLESFDAWE